VAGERVYVIDTCTLVHIWDQLDGRAIIEAIVEMVALGRVRTVDKVLDELKRWPELHARMNSVRAAMIVPHLAEPRMLRVVDDVLTACEDLIDQTGGKNPDPADPWLIAVAAVRSTTAAPWIVVTDENPRSPKKIPALCAGRCACISGSDFLTEVGILTTAV
jgi:hypothetical protein